MDQPNHVTICEFVQLGNTANLLLHRFMHVYFIMYFTKEDFGALQRGNIKAACHECEGFTQEILTFYLVAHYLFSSSFWSSRPPPCMAS